MYIDSHVHLDAPAFDQDRAEVIARALEGGVEHVLNIGGGYLQTVVLEKSVALADEYDLIRLAFGIHPHDARYYTQEWEDKLLSLCRHPKVLAWGEIGLDYHYDASPREVQRDVFRQQLRLARERGLPVIIHTREAEADTRAILREEWHSSGLGGIMHCFTGTYEMAKASVDMRFLISFSGILTFKTATALRDVARQLPSDCLLIETDCPLLAPAPFRGKRNEPAYVRSVAQHLGQVRGCSEEDIGRLTASNFRRFFNLLS